MTESRRKFLGKTGALALGALAAPRAAALVTAKDERDSMSTTTTKQDTKSAGPHVLPPLPYAADALEPFYDTKTVELHHDVHHKGYVDGLNKAEAELAELLKGQDFAKAKSIAKAMAFHGSGHVLHSIFWTNMKPKGGGEPEGELAKKVAADFGSFKAFRGYLLAAANSAEGSGWGIVGHRKSDDKLLVLQVEKHENFIQWGVTPLLALDVWEHAYYLKYANKRTSWTETFVDKLVNWEDVAQRLAKSRA